MKTKQVLTNQSDDYYEMIFENTSGVLFPGGGQNLFNSTYTYSAEVGFQAVYVLRSWWIIWKLQSFSFVKVNWHMSKVIFIQFGERA